MRNFGGLHARAAKWRCLGEGAGDKVLRAADLWARWQSAVPFVRLSNQLSSSASSGNRFSYLRRERVWVRCFTGCFEVIFISGQLGQRRPLSVARRRPNAQRPHVHRPEDRVAPWRHRARNPLSSHAIDERRRTESLKTQHMQFITYIYAPSGSRKFALSVKIKVGSLTEIDYFHI